MNKVLIVVDYQKDFVDGVIRNKAARDIEFRICEKIEKYRSAGNRRVNRGQARFHSIYCAKDKCNCLSAKFNRK